jgi:hypothetical protein
MLGEEPVWLPLPEGPVQRIAFGSCAKHWQPQPIWEAILASGNGAMPRQPTNSPPPAADKRLVSRP